MLAHTTHLDGVTAPSAALPVAAVHGETTLDVGSGHPTDPTEVGTQHAGRGHDQATTVVLAERGHGREGMHRLGPEDLAAIDVPDPAGDVLVEQCLCDGGVTLGVVVQPTHALLEQFVRGRAQIGPERTEAGMPVDVELAICLDHRGAEAHRHPVGHLEDGSHVVVALAPPLTTAVEVPRARHAHVAVEHQPVVPDDLEVLAVALDPLDDPTEDRTWPIEERGVESNCRTPDERSPQGGGCSVDRVPLRHGTNLIPDAHSGCGMPLSECPCTGLTTSVLAVEPDDRLDEDDVDPATEEDDTTEPRRLHGPVGTAIGAAMVGLDQVIFGRQREEAPIVIAASGEPGDVDTDGIVIPLDDEADLVAPPLPPSPPIVAPRRRRRLW